MPRGEVRDVKKKKGQDTVMVSEIQPGVRQNREENHSFPLAVLHNCFIFCCFLMGSLCQLMSWETLFPMLQDCLAQVYSSLLPFFFSSQLIPDTKVLTSSPIILSQATSLFLFMDGLPLGQASILVQSVIFGSGIRRHKTQAPKEQRLRTENSLEERHIDKQNIQVQYLWLDIVVWTGNPGNGVQGLILSHASMILGKPDNFPNSQILHIKE